MAHDEMPHPRYAKIHPEWQTHWGATFVIWFLGVLLGFVPLILGGLRRAKGAKDSSAA